MKRHNSSDYISCIKNGTCFVIDLNRGQKSVTNDAEGVLKDLGVSRMLYRDSENEWSSFDETKGFNSLTDNENMLLDKLFAEDKILSKFTEHL